MSDPTRVRQLLELLLEGELTPEEVCAGDPDLLPEVRARAARLHQVAGQLDELFPDADPLVRLEAAGEAPLPQVEGYEVEAVLGRGGMGVVFRARQLKPNRPVALKMLLAGTYATPQEVARFAREVEAVSALRHPNIVQIHDVGEHAGRPYFTMELVEGGSLAQRLARGRVAPGPVAELVATLAVAVQFAHRSGIIHRDLKPANILLTAPPAEGRRADVRAPWGTPKIADFGLARFINAGPELTRSGARLGTPGYMAPEQALGRTADIGPAADIYSLGAILYEALTGRPPFAGPSAAEMERQVISEEPFPPSRFSAVPRDLETICLKCLHKNPARRYASAEDLADDLYRFLDGKPVRARPVGLAGRALKWARRRPAAALAGAALLVLVGTASGAGVWFHQQQTDRRAAKERRQEHARSAIRSTLDRVAEHRKKEQWPEAGLILTEAAPYIADVDWHPLEEEFRRAESDVQLAGALASEREDLLYLANGEPDYRRRATTYQQLLGRAGINLGAEPATNVAVINRSEIRPQLLAAVVDWAFVMYQLKDRATAVQLLDLARAADPEPLWRDKLRDARFWEDMPRLRELSDTAFTISPPPSEQDLALLGFLLRRYSGGHRNTDLLDRACRLHPGSFWLNSEMGDALFLDDRSHEALGYFRAARALRPRNASVYYKISRVLLQTGRTEEGLVAARRAVRLSGTGLFRAHLVQSLAQAGYWTEAMTECQQALKTDPPNPRAATNLASALKRHGRTEDALALFRRAVEVAPDDFITRCTLADTLTRLNRHAEAEPHYRAALALQPNNPHAHDLLARALVAVGRPEEAVREFRASIAISPNLPGRNEELAAVLRSLGQVEDAIAVLRTTMTGRVRGSTWDALAVAELDRGNFAEARTATQRALALPAADTDPQAQRQRLEMCNALLAVESQLPALLAGEQRTTSSATLLALAEWCFDHKRCTAMAADFFAAAMAAEPALIRTRSPSIRFRAACAAALAGCGVGKDAAALGAERRAELRKQARDWLTAECAVWKARHDEGKPGARTGAARAMKLWQLSRDLAPVRDENALATLDPDERREWLSLWAMVAVLVEREPGATIARARACVARRDWTKAAELYSAGLALEPTEDSNIWFEYAAAQLLAGDRPGYLRSCTHMLARAPVAPNMRKYHAARACTLAPGSTPDLEALLRLLHSELGSNSGQFWALTEFGALFARSKEVSAAPPSLFRSLLADGRPGRAVLNWLWLALAYQKMGNTDEARRWLDKATEWLDQQGDRMPVESEDMGSHRHNWLEAQILLREAKKLLAPPPNSPTPGP
jgi:serine/threonine-protein kinase